MLEAFGYQKSFGYVVMLYVDKGFAGRRVYPSLDWARINHPNLKERK